MLSYLIKVSAIWLIFLLFYHLLLSKESSASKSRWYLWSSLILGLIIPLIHMPSYYAQEAIDFTFMQNANQANPFNEEIVLNNEASSTESSTFSIVWLLAGLYMLGMLYFLFKNIIDVLRLNKLKRTAALKMHAISSYYIHKKVNSPFSFRKTIFLPQRDYSEQDLAFILAHEKQHHIYKHWIDNILLNLFQMALWFHPLIYLYKRNIQLVHEYQIDAKVKAADKYDYAQLLLTENQYQNQQILAHRFSFSPLKNRIMMMTNNKKHSLGSIYLHFL